MDIFISYSSKDTDTIKPICEIFSDNKFDYWVAYKNCNFGDHYAATIIKMISEADIFLVFVSQNSNLSTHVINEISAAVGRGKKIVPVILDEFDLSPAFEYYLSSNHFIRYYNNDKFLDQLLHRIYDLLGREYVKKQSVNQPTIIDEEVQALLDLANKGDVEAIYKLGKKYYAGSDNLNKDLKKAFEYFKKAADLNHPLAQCDVAWCYEEGSGVEQDWEKAFQLYSLSAANNCSMAQYSLGWMYDNGIFVKRNRSKAVQMYIKAAENGHAMAQYKLGMAYMEGVVVDCDYVTANHWLMLASDQGVVFAQYKLAENFYFGYGCKQDIIRAKNLWVLSSAKGYHDSDKALEKYYDIFYNDSDKTFLT